MFPELLNICSDRRVRDLQDFRHTAVIHFDLEHLRIRIALRKFENVLEVRAAPGVNRLRVVPDHHQVAMVAREQVDKVSLDFVRVLVFVDEDELKLPTVKGSDLLMLDEPSLGLAPKLVLMTPVEAVRKVAKKVGWELLDYYDESRGISAMMRTTGYSLAITGVMQVDGRTIEIDDPDAVGLGVDDDIWLRPGICPKRRSSAEATAAATWRETRRA